MKPSVCCSWGALLSLPFTLLPPQASAQDSSDPLAPLHSASQEIRRSLEEAEARLDRLAAARQRHAEAQHRQATLEDALSKLTLQKALWEAALATERGANEDTIDALRTANAQLQSKVDASGAIQDELVRIKAALLKEQTRTEEIQLASSEKATETAQLQAAHDRLRGELEAAHATQRRLLKTLLHIAPMSYAMNSSEVTLQQNRILAQVRQVLTIYPQAVVEVTGHTCTIGSESANLALSQSRAEGLREFLVENAIPSDQVIAKGMGQTRPVASNATDAGRRENRRVEITVHPLGLGLAPAASEEAN